MDKNIISMFKSNGLEEYIVIFKENKLESFEYLKRLTDADLEKLGIDNIAHRKILLSIFSKRKKQLINKKILIAVITAITLAIISITAYAVYSKNKAEREFRELDEEISRRLRAPLYTPSR